MRALFVVNAAAGHGRGRQRFEKAAKDLPRGKWEADFTKCPGDAARIAREAVEAGYKAIIAVGGDGTVGEALNGFMASGTKRWKSALGTWPAGSGCDLARHLGLRNDAATISALLERGQVRRLDAGIVEYHTPKGEKERRHFLNVTSFGVAGEVARRMEKSGKPFGGTASYLFSSVAALLTTPPRELSLIADGQELPRERYHLVSVANTSTTGGGMRIAPAADAEDGRLDLVTVGDMPRARLLRSFPAVYRGDHLELPGVSHRLVHRLEARSKEPVYLNIDGEAVGVLPAVFEALPRAVPFLLPA